MPVGALLCVLAGPTAGRPWSATAARATLRHLGEADPWIPVERGIELSSRIPHARLELLPTAGHLVQEDQPDKLVQLLREHLEFALT
jgi:pimeloyl-ACP methyl ester carboxylesterase